MTELIVVFVRPRTFCSSELRLFRTEINALAALLIFFFQLKKIS